MITLQENFYKFENHKKKSTGIRIQVKLTGSGIYLNDNSITTKFIHLNDIIGSHCGTELPNNKFGRFFLNLYRYDNNKEKYVLQDQQLRQNINIVNQHGDRSAYLNIFVYYRNEQPLRRIRYVIVLKFQSCLTYVANLSRAECWHTAIRFNKTCNSNLNKSLLIILNPKSGSGSGRQLFQTYAAPIFKEAEIQYELVVTTRSNCARELIRERSDLLNCFRGIIVASGDGLFFEVLNGMMERSDWPILVRNLCLGILPCGSGNGLAKSISHAYNEPYEPWPIVNAALTCASGKNAPLDIVSVEMCIEHKYVKIFSFLSVGWGLIADIDIESERLRRFGSQRFSLWSIYRLLHLRIYKGKVSYLPWSKAHCDKSKILITPEATNKNKINKFCDIDSACEDHFILTSNNTSYKNVTISKQSTTKYKQRNGFVDDNKHILPSSLPQLNKPVPQHWLMEQGEFVMIHAAYTSHLSAGCNFVPDAKLNDGIIYLVIIRAGISRSQLITFLLKMSSGTHFNETSKSTYINVIPVYAFRIEPFDNNGIMTVDGERVACGPIQAEILPGMIQLMVPNTINPENINC